MTRDGQPVARVSPAEEDRAGVAAAVEELRRYRREKRPTLGEGVTIRELIEDGRDRRFSFLAEENPDEDRRRT